MIVLWKSKDLPTAQITIPIKHFKTKVILSGMTASPRDGAEQIKPATLKPAPTMMQMVLQSVMTSLQLLNP